MTPAWIVCAWPPVMWQACSTPDLHFVHLGTSVLSHGDQHQPRTGQTLWGNPLEPSVAGVAWDWVQLAHGVYVMADPLGLVTNLRLVGDHGETLTQSQMALYLNEMVRHLPWQQEVNRALQALNTSH